jgi:hypothetical protein
MITVLLNNVRKVGELVISRISCFVSSDIDYIYNMFLLKSWVLVSCEFADHVDVSEKDAVSIFMG